MPFFPEGYLLDDPSLNQDEFNNTVANTIGEMIGNDIPPVKPSGFNLIKQSGGIEISFNPINELGITNYEIFKNPNRSFVDDRDSKLLISIPQVNDFKQKVTYIDPHGLGNTFYWVRAVKNLHNPSILGAATKPTSWDDIQASLQVNQTPETFLAGALPAPYDLAVVSVTDGFQLEFRIKYTETEIANILGFVVYHRTSAGVDKTNGIRTEFLGFNKTDLEYERVWPNRFTTSSTNLFFSPITDNGGFRVVDNLNTYYFRIAAINRDRIESPLSNEDSGKVTAVTGPTLDVPPEPTVEVSVQSEFTLRIQAKRPTEALAETQILAFKKATLELYRGSTPTTDTVPADPLVASIDDTSSPYELITQVKTAVNAAGGLPVNFWGRARFTDIIDVVGSYGLSDVFELNAENNTTDTDVVDTSDIIIDVDIVASDGNFNTFLIGVAPADNGDSATETNIQLRVYEGPGVNFNSSTGYSSALFYDLTNTSSPNGTSLFTISEISNSTSWEVTARIKNAYGWSDFLTPIKITPSYDTLILDDDIPTINKFALWTQDNPPGGGLPGIVPGNAAYIECELGINNSSTFGIGLFGHSSSTFPSETTYLSNSSADLTADLGLTVITIDGYAATLNEFAGKILRLGKDTGKNDPSVQILEEHNIVSNTAASGGVFTLTIQVATRNNGAIPNWAIIESPVRSLVDFYETIDVDVTGPIGTYKAIEFSKIIPIKRELTGKYFAIQAINWYGRSAFKYADGTANGTDTAGSAVAKTLPGVTEEDVKDSLKDLIVDVVFTADAHDEISWAAGDIYYGDGTDEPVNSGSATGLSTNTTYYVKKSLTNATLVVETSPALGISQVIIAIVRTTSVTTEYAAIVVRGGTSVITAAVGVFGQLSAISADLGAVTAGTITGLTIQTDESPDARLKLTTADGLECFDSSNVLRLNIPNSWDSLNFYNPSGVLTGTLAGSASDGCTLFGFEEVTIGSFSVPDGVPVYIRCISGETVTDPSYLQLQPGGSTVIEAIRDSGVNYFGAFGVTAVVQPATTGTTTGFTAGSGTGVNDDSTFTGGVGSKAYTVGDVVKALKDLGWMAAS